MLAFTNRAVQDVGDASAFTTRYDAAASALSCAEVSAADDGWALSQLTADLGDDVAVLKLVELFRGDKPVLVHVHGCFNPPPVCFARGQLLETQYGVRVVLFSWPAEGMLADGSDPAGAKGGAACEESGLAQIDRDNKGKGLVAGINKRYQQAKHNGEAAAGALARLLRLVATARLFANVQPFSVSAHSLGGLVMQHTLAQSGAIEALGAAVNVTLIAPCTKADGHKAWLGQIKPKGRVFVTFNDDDNVLFGARIVDGDEIKLGAEPGDDRVVSDSMRYVSFTNYQVGAFGHTYFALPKMPKAAAKVFGRLLGSAPDLKPGEVVRKVYPMGCDADGLMCSMGPDDPPLA